MSQYHFKHLNIRLILYCLILSVVGVLLIRSATIDNIDYAGYYKKQIFAIVAGLVVMAGVTLFNYRWLMKLWPALYILNIGLLIATRLFGVVKGGAKRWISLPVVGRFQPSELTKLALIVCMAYILDKRKDRINEPFTWLLILLMCGPHVALIFLQPDLSTTLLLLLIIIIMIYVAKLSYKIIATVLAIGLPAGIFAVYYLLNLDSTDDYRIRRILSFIDPAKYQDSIYQQENSVMAIGSGGLLGKGLNTTTFESVKNGNYLAEAHTDFIFTIAGEELGFVGCFLILLTILLLVIEILAIARKADSMAGRQICVGVAAMIAVQSFFNIAVATWLMPNTGIPLPFISYGMTSMVSTYIAIGMVLNVGLQRKVKEKDPLKPYMLQKSRASEKRKKT